MILDPSTHRSPGIAARSGRALDNLAAVCAALLALAGTAGSALAGGSETFRSAHEMSLTVDSRWVGGAYGGYYPIRIRLTNTARPRVLEFRIASISGEESKLPTVVRRVQVDQNATLQFTLAIPLVSDGTRGELRVYENGRLLEPFTLNISMPDVGLGTPERPALLVIHPSPSSIDCSSFETAAQSLAAGRMPTSGRGAGTLLSSLGHTVSRSEDALVLAPILLPESWIDYTTVDIVAVPLATFEKLPSAVRGAIVKWVEAGGTLLVSDVGEPGSDSKTLAKLLDPGGRSFAPDLWSAARPELAKPITIHFEEEGSVKTGMPLSAGPTTPAADVEAEKARLLKQANTALWPQLPPAFSSRPIMAGRVYAFPGNPFPGAAIDWAWWLNSADWSTRLNWTARFGNSGRRYHPEFYKFLIAGVGGIPVLPLILLISVFAIVIGPVNYFITLRRKQLYLLVVTIPAIAFLTSVALLSYAMIADGFRVQSRLRSFTLLDQGAKRAVSFNRISLYAGLAPSAGLRFSPETAVIPVWKDDLGLESGTVDWTETQALTNGWLHSRTRTQFETLAHRDERGRVEFSSPHADTPPEASNGLALEIDALIVRDDQGRLFSGRKIPAGGSQKLHPLEPADLAILTESLTRFPLQAPPGAEESSSLVRRGRRGWAYIGYDSEPKIGFINSLLETGLQNLSRADREASQGGLAPRSYFATFRENPGIELGVERTIPRDGVHVLLGLY